MQLAKKFKFIVEHHVERQNAPMYTAEKIESVDADNYKISWVWPASTPKSNQWTIYPQRVVEENIISGVWRVQEVSLDNEVFKFCSTPLSVPGTWTLKDEPVVPNISLSDLQKFTNETDWDVGIEPEFYILSFDGEIEYVVKSEAELLEAMNAIRILNKFSDKG